MRNKPPITYNKTTRFAVFICIVLVLLTSIFILMACGDDTQEHIHTPGHAVVENYVAPSGATEGSYDEVVYCTVCEDELSREHKTVPHTHKAGAAVEENKIDATCTKNGSYDEVVYCEYCHYELSRVNKTISAQHTPDEPVQEDRVEPKCNAYGYYYEVVYCKDCDEKISRSDVIMLDPIEHNLVSHTAKKPTCTEFGWEAYDECTECGLSTYVEIPSKGGHVWGTPVEEDTVESTCSTAGHYYDVVYCTVCKEEVSRVLVPLALKSHMGDTPVEENRVEPTCTTFGGYDSVIRCKECKEVMSRMHVDLPMLNHVPGEVKKENIIEPVYGYRNTGTSGGYDEVTYCKDCKNEMYRAWVNTVVTPHEYYSQYDYLELSSTTNAPNNLTLNADGTHTLIAQTKGGKSIRLLIEGEITPLDGGWGCFDKNTKVYLLDAMPGINYIEYEIASKTTEFSIAGYCSLQKKASVESFDELFSFGGMLIGGNSLQSYSEASNYPDYLCLNDRGSTLQLVSMRIYYCNVMSEVVDIQLNKDLYESGMSNAYLPGDWYDGKIEKGAVEAFNYNYPLNILLDNTQSLAGQNKHYSSIIEFADNVKFGNIIDASGNIVNKNNRFLQAGDKIEVTIGSCTKNLDLCIDIFEGDTLYDAFSSGYIKSVGTQNVLVVPITFNDQKDRIDNDWLSLLKKTLGNVMDANGNVTKHTLSNGEWPLSEYLATSSYGKFTANFYIAEPYVINATGKEYFYESVPESIYSDIEASLHNQNFDNSKFDQNGDGYYDVVILINTLCMADGDGISYGQGSMSGAYEYSLYMTSDNAGTAQNPTINTCFSAAAFHLFGDQEELNEDNVKTHTLIHEFGHTFGLMDYYCNGKPQNTIGKFDMEADNQGDWNSYSKYVMGWIEPTVVDGSKESVEIEIGAYSTHGDAILIRALGYNGTGTPFDEYIMIDLFAHDGLYEKHSLQYGLSETVGVRIYHVNSLYELQTVRGDNNPNSTFAAPHHSASDTSKYATQGKYLLEMVQKGNVNTFMKDLDLNSCTHEEILGTYVDKDDLFYQGDVFTVEDYDNFFYNGKMDNGMEFGYKITVKSIVEDGANSTATILIEKISQD